MNEILVALFYGGPLAGAVLLGLLLPVGFIFGLSATKGVGPTTRLTIIVASMALGTTLSLAFSGRALYSEAQLLANPFLAQTQAQVATLGVRMSQLFTLIALAGSTMEILRWALRQQSLGRLAKPIWLALMCYFLAIYLVAGAFGNYRTFSVSNFYAVTVGTAILLLAERSGPRFWTVIRWVLLLVGIASLALMAIKPDLVLQPDYGASVIPGFPKRLFGLSDHANKMSMVAGAALVIELCPMVRRRPALLFLLVQAIVLLLTQSKTMILATAAAVFLVRLSWLHDRLSRKDSFRGTALVLLLLLALGGAGVVGLAFALRSRSLLAALNDMGALSFTGRTDIWAITLDEFRKNPLTGFGPALWDLRFRYERNLLAVGHAHNQFVQVLGQAGIVGFITLMSYLGLMLRQVWRTGLRVNSLGAGLMTLLLIDCVSETPMNLAGINGWDNWLHFIVLAAVANAGMARTSEAVERVARPVSPGRHFSRAHLGTR